MPRPPSLQTILACFAGFGAGVGATFLWRPSSALPPFEQQQQQQQGQQQHQQQQQQQQIEQSSLKGSEHASSQAIPAPPPLPVPGHGEYAGDSGLAHPATRHGVPTGPESSLIVARGFVASFDGRTRNARWVVERMTAATLRGEVSRRGMEFWEEQSVEPLFRNKLRDFRGSGYDRGHLSAAANHKSSREAMLSTFTLANISPQVGKGFNRDYWARLEGLCRRLARKDESADVFVVTGPLWLPTLKKQKAVRSVGHAATNAQRDDDDVPQRQLPPSTSEVEVAVVVPSGPGGEQRAAAAASGHSKHLSPSSAEVTVPSEKAPAQNSLIQKKKELSRGEREHRTRESHAWEVRHNVIGEAPEFVAVPTHFYKVILIERNCHRRTRTPTSSSNTTLAAANEGGAVPIEAELPKAEVEGEEHINIVASSAPQFECAAVVIPNAAVPEDTPLRQFVVPLRSLEAAAGLRFFGDVFISQERRQQFEESERQWLQSTKNVEAGRGSTSGPVRQLLLESEFVSASAADPASNTSTAQAGEDDGAEEDALAEALVHPGTTTTTTQAVVRHLFHVEQCLLPPPWRPPPIQAAL